MLPRRLATQSLRRPFGQIAIRAFGGHGPPPQQDGWFPTHITPACTRPADHPKRVEFIDNIDMIRNKIAPALDGQGRKFPEIWIHSILGIALGFVFAEMFKNSYWETFILMDKWSLMDPAEKQAIKDKYEAEAAEWWPRFQAALPLPTQEKIDDRAEKAEIRHVKFKAAEYYLDVLAADDD